MKASGLIIAAMLGLACAHAIAQDMAEITVQGTRLVATRNVGRAASGMPVNAVSISYNVSFKDVDLASRTGFMEAERRVRELADTACKEIGKLHPGTITTVTECSKAATDKAMVVVKGWADKTGKPIN
jgi:UrcA family protein